MVREVVMTGRETQNDTDPKTRPDRLVTVRVSEQERDLLNRLCQQKGVSLNQWCRDQLGLAADTTPRTQQRGNPNWVRAR